MRKRFGQSLIILLLAIGFFAIPRIYTAAAAGTLYVNPSSTAPLPVGSTFSVQIKVNGIDQFNGWEIQVASDRSVISPTIISTAGNIFLTNTTGGIAFELRNSVNGVGTGSCLSTSCSPLDGPGIADSAYGYTRLASGTGLLFTVTFKVVSSGPFSPITIQNDQFSNGGSSGVAHTTSGGVYGSLSSISVSKFFTDGNLAALPLDNNNNPSVNVLLVNGVIRSTTPGVIVGWLNVTNTGITPLQSVSIDDSLPVDWLVHPRWDPAKGAIHVYYANTTNLATNPEITDPSTIGVGGQTVVVDIPSFNSTGIGHPLLPGQSVLLAVDLKYGLDMTSQSPASYPRTYTDTASVTAWTGASYIGTQTAATGAASIVAHARPLGDLNGDGCVNILDIGVILSAYGSTPASAHWNPNADFDSDNYVGINDVTMALNNYNACM